MSKPSDYGSNFASRFFIKNVLTYETIVMNDIVSSFNYQDLYVKNVNSTEMWHFTKEATHKTHNKFIRLFIVFFDMLKIAFGLFLTSAITAIYIKITIICAPIFILVIIAILNRMGNNEINRNTLYR